MQLVLQLFWLGFLICAALFIFNMVISVVFGVIAAVFGGLYLGITTVVTKLRGK
jgi:hypothetical protein